MLFYIGLLIFTCLNLLFYSVIRNIYIYNPNRSYNRFCFPNKLSVLIRVIIVIIVFLLCRWPVRYLCPFRRKVQVYSHHLQCARAYRINCILRSRANLSLSGCPGHTYSLLIIRISCTYIATGEKWSMHRYGFIRPWFFTTRPNFLIVESTW
jgi:hypothetical protein